MIAIGIDTPDEITCKLWKKEGAPGIYVTPDGLVLKVVPQWEGNSNTNYSGYPCVTVGPYNRAVHQVVADCYVPNDAPEVKNQVDHIDGNKCNNHYSNLEWVTCQENIERSYQSGGHSGIGVRCIETGQEFRSCRQASIYYRGDESMTEGIRRCVHGKQSHCGGLHWEVIV